jgi:tRNA(Ile)-lysidine synthase
MNESITMRLPGAARKTIAGHGMINRNDAVLAAVSGGPDSMALLHLLGALASANGFRLGVAHLNHGLRPGAAASDEALVRRTAETMSLPYYTETADVRGAREARGGSLEEVAREVRYRFLEKTADTHGFNVVALGHHADDNAELVLMNLLRGSGPTGLSGMPPVRQFRSDGSGRGDIRLIRPLMEVRREEILSYLSENDIPFALDSSNQDLRHRRNRIRHELLPLLRERYNPNIVETLNRTAELLRAEETWTGSLLAPLPTSDGSGIPLSRDHLRNAHPGYGRRLIRGAIEGVKGNLRRITLRHVDAVLALALRPDPSGSLDLPDRIRVAARGDALLFTREECPLRQVPSDGITEGAAGFEHLLNAPGTLFIPELPARLRATPLPPGARPELRNAGHRTAFFDMETVSFPLTVRNPRPGDRFTPLGMTGRQKIKKFFIDHKIPADERSRWPLLESRGEVIWVMGCRMDDSVKITAATRQVLKVELDLA